VVLSDTADFIYKCTDYYHPASEQGILWNDPEIGIQWPLSDVQLSDKDLALPLLHSQLQDKLSWFKKAV
jgi:dTDP-4-dehydrorhamnose 3,5-epimerase